jgi:hypothetical protein
VPCRESYWFVSPKDTVNTASVKAFRAWVKEELGVPADRRAPR